MNNLSSTKGPGDFEPECQPEPTEQQILNAMRNNPVAVWRNLIDSRSGYADAAETAMTEFIRYESTEKLNCALYDSAKELLEAGKIQ